MRPLVVIESPWAGMGNWAKAREYLSLAIRHSISLGELPFASHAMYAHTSALDEDDPDQRAEGIELQKAMILRADFVAIYVDHGISSGMRAGQFFAVANRKKIVARRINEL